MKKIILIAFCLFCSSLAFSGGWGSKEVFIGQFLVEGENRAYVSFSEVPFPNECQSNGNHYYRIDPTTHKGKAMISMILAIKLANKKVIPLVSGCDDWKRPILKGLSIY